MSTNLDDDKNNNDTHTSGNDGCDKSVNSGVVYSSKSISRQRASQSKKKTNVTRDQCDEITKPVSHSSLQLNVPKKKGRIKKSKEQKDDNSSSSSDGGKSRLSNDSGKCSSKDSRASNASSKGSSKDSKVSKDYSKHTKDYSKDKQTAQDLKKSGRAKILAQSDKDNDSGSKAQKVPEVPTKNPQPTTTIINNENANANKKTSTRTILQQSPSPSSRSLASFPSIANYQKQQPQQEEYENNNISQSQPASESAPQEEPKKLEVPAYIKKIVTAFRNKCMYLSGNDDDPLFNGPEAQKKYEEYIQRLNERDIEDGLVDTDGKMTRKSLQLELDKFYSQIIPTENDLLPQNIRKWMYSHFTKDRCQGTVIDDKFKNTCLDENSQDPSIPEFVRAVYAGRMIVIIRLFYELMKKKMLRRVSKGANFENVNNYNNETKVSYISELLTYCYKSIESEHLVRTMTSKKNTSTFIVPERVRTFTFHHMTRAENDTKESPFMQLLIHILGRLFAFQYRRVGGYCYEEIITAEGYHTHAWKEKMSIEQFILENTSKDVFFTQFQNLMASKDNLNTLVDRLKRLNEIEFPELKPDRHIFSFRNGIYLALSDEFMPYETAVSLLKKDVTAIKYFNSEWEQKDYFFVDYDKNGKEVIKFDILKIPTPNASKIMENQNLHWKVEYYLWALMGRCIFGVGELDTWQIIPFVKGLAGTGKSTLGKMVQLFYNTENIAIIGNSFEERFGLMSMYTKLICICYEMSNKINLAQTDLQSMASGEEMNIARKYLDAITVTWNASVLLFGNRIGNWIDTAGSMQRRLVTFEFHNSVKEGDTHLIKKIETEMPNVIRKCVKAYRALVLKNGKQEFWSFCPQYFHDTKSNMRKMVNPFHAFMEECDMFIYDENAYMPADVLKLLFFQHCRDNNIRKGHFDTDVYSEEFEQRNIKIECNKRLFWKNAYANKKKMWFVGLTVREADGRRLDGNSNTGKYGIDHPCNHYIDPNQKKHAVGGGDRRNDGDGDNDDDYDGQEEEEEEQENHRPFKVRNNNNNNTNNLRKRPYKSKHGPDSDDLLMPQEPDLSSIQEGKRARMTSASYMGVLTGAKNDNNNNNSNSNSNNGNGNVNVGAAGVGFSKHQTEKDIEIEEYDDYLLQEYENGGANNNEDDDNNNNGPLRLNSIS